MIASLELIALAWLPGAVIFRVPLANRDRRAKLDAGERAFWAVIISVALSLTITIALAALHRYSFSRLLTANGMLVVALVATWRGRLLYRGNTTPAGPTVLVPIALALLGAWLYFPASEYIMGGKDPGVYVSEGIQIAQRGAIRILDPDIAAVPAPMRDLFFPSHHQPWYYGTRFMGFFIMDPDRGTVTGQFPHLYPASIAIGYGVAGLTGARDAIAIWAILGLLAVYVMAAPLVGRAGAFGASMLLGLNVLVVWFGRYPNSELPLQALLFAALAAYGRALEGDRAFFAPLAGALLSLQLLLRFDALIALAAFAAATAIAGFARLRVGRGFLLVLLPGTALGLWYLAVLMQPYSVGFFGYWRDSSGWLLLVIALIAALAARAAARNERIAATGRQLIPVLTAATVLVLATYAYFFREAGGRLAYPDAQSFRSFAWYTTRAGLAGATIGFAYLSWRAFWKNPAFFLTVAMFGIVFFYKTRAVPEHFWVMRRFLVAVLPAAMIGLAAAVAGIGAWSAGRVPRRLRRGAAPLIVLALLLPFAVVFHVNALPVSAHVEYAGLIPQLESLASHIGPDDLLLVESRNASDLHVLALPLAYIYSKHVLVLNTPRPDKAQLTAFLSWARTKYPQVLFIGGGGTDLLNRRISATALDSLRFQIPEYASTLNAYPSGVQRKEFDFGLYRLTDTPESPAEATVVTVGHFDDLRVVRFNAKERRPDKPVPFRWSRDSSYVVLLPFAGDYRSVTIWMSSGGRPPSAPAPRVTLSLNGSPLGQVTPVDAIQPYTFPIPKDVAVAAARAEDPPLLRLEVPTWNPRRLFGGGDARDLGVIVSRVQVSR